MTEAFWIKPTQVFDGRDLLQNNAIRISDGKVTDIKPAGAVPQDALVQRCDGILTPGFFDIQVNGGGGVLLNTTPTTDGIATIVKAHRQFGTTAILPTVITDAPDVLSAAVDAVIETKGLSGVMGLHIEGPHISVSRRGTHAAKYVRPLDDVTMDHARRLRDAAVPVLMTVAPEAVDNSQIAALCDMGVIVSIGHSDATAPVAAQAVSAGASLFTHLFNGMSAMENRAPGVTGAAIMSNAWCSIIADGIHVDPLMIKLATKARPLPDRMIAVSDAMATVGGPDTFDLYGQQIKLCDGRLINAEGSLAGAHLTLLDALRNLVSYGFELEEALRMCWHNPVALMGLSARMPFVGRLAKDIVWLDDGLGLKSVGVSRSQAISDPA